MHEVKKCSVTPIPLTLTAKTLEINGKNMTVTFFRQIEKRYSDELRRIARFEGNLLIPREGSGAEILGWVHYPQEGDSFWVLCLTKGGNIVRFVAHDVNHIALQDNGDVGMGWHDPSAPKVIDAQTDPHECWDEFKHHYKQIFIGSSIG